MVKYTLQRSNLTDNVKKLQKTVSVNWLYKWSPDCWSYHRRSSPGIEEWPNTPTPVTSRRQHNMGSPHTPTCVPMLLIHWYTAFNYVHNSLRSPILRGRQPLPDYRPTARPWVNTHSSFNACSSCSSQILWSSFSWWRHVLSTLQVQIFVLTLALICLLRLDMQKWHWFGSHISFQRA